MLDFSQLLLATEVLLRTEALPGGPRNVLQQTLKTCERGTFVHVRTDLEIAGDLPLDWDAPLWRGRNVCGLFVEGDLKVGGSLTNLAPGSGPTLVVLGDVEAGRVVHGDSKWLIRGNLRVRDTFFGDDNDGYVWIGGDLDAAAVIDSGHYFLVSGQTRGKRINDFLGHAWLADGLYDEEAEDGEEVAWGAVSERARRGEPLLRQTPRQVDLLTAAAEPEPDLLQAAIAAGADLEARNHNGATPLLMAIVWGRLANVEALLAAGADVRAVDESGQGAVHWLAFSGNDKILETVLAHRPPLDGRDHEGRTPMMRAIDYKNLSLVRALRQRGVALPPPEPGSCYPYSLLLGERTRLELLDELISAGMPLDWQEPGDDIFPGGKTLLHEAAWKGNVAGVERLLRAGAKVDVREERGRTPLRLLLEISPRVLTDEEAIAAIEAITKLLLQEGADPLAKAQDGRDALDLVLEARRPGLLKAVLEAAAATGRLDPARRSKAEKQLGR